MQTTCIVCQSSMMQQPQQAALSQRKPLYMQGTGTVHSLRSGTGTGLQHVAAAALAMAGPQLALQPRLLGVMLGMATTAVAAGARAPLLPCSSAAAAQNPTFPSPTTSTHLATLNGAGRCFT